MDNNANSYSNRNNAKRAAEAMITKGTAPAVDYGIKPRDDGRFAIVWKTGDKAVTTDEVETEVAEAAAAADQLTQPAEPAPLPATDQWFPGTEGTHFAGLARGASHPRGAERGESAGAESELAPTAPPPEEPDPF